MAANRKIISEQELKGIIASRASLGPQAAKVIYYRQIDYPIVFDGLNRNPNVFNATLFFKDCKFNAKVDIPFYDFAGRISFEKCIFNDIVIFRTYGSGGNVEFSNDCEFNNNLTLFLKTNGDEVISDLSIAGSLRIRGTDLSNLTIENINVGSKTEKQQLFLYTQSRSLTVRNVIVDELLFGERAKGINLILFEDVYANKFLINGIELETLLGLSHIQVGELTFENVFGSKREMKIDNSSIKKLRLPLSQFAKADISECTIEEFNITDENEQNSILNIEKIITGKFQFEKVFNNGLISLRQLMLLLDGIISIKSSNLGRTDFINCNFSKTILEFENSKLTEVFFSETDFPKKVIINGVPNNAQAQLAFGQLTNAFQKQGIL